MLTRKLTRILSFIAFVTLLAASSYAQMPKSPDFPTNMKKYFLVLVLAGDQKPPSPEQHEVLKQQHLAFVRSQIEAGKFILVGPALDDGHLKGVCVVNASTVEEAKQAWAGDPFVKAGETVLEVHPVMLPDLSSVHVDYPKADGK
jgi:uncharacterized protein YciI